MAPRRPPTTRRAVIYRRQSAPRDESVSMEQQEIACRDYCNRRGYLVVAVEEDGITGQTWRRRPGVQRAMAMIEDRSADLIVLWKWSRLARRTLDFEVALDRARVAGGEIESATESVDTSTAAGRFQRGVLSQVAAFEAERIGEGWMETHARRRAQGQPAQGGQRFGYRRVYSEETGKVVGYRIDETQASTLRWMYHEVIEGRGATSITRELNRREVPNPRGNAWNRDTIYRLLDSGFAAGLLIHRPRADPHAATTYHEGAQPQIIDLATWEQYRLARRARATLAPRVVEPRYPLTGLVHCGICGNAMWVARSKGKGAGHTLVCGLWQRTRTTRCVTIVRRRAEEAVVAWLAEYAASVDAATNAEDALKQRLGRARRTAKGATRQMALIEERLSRLARAWAEGVIPTPGYAEARDGYLRELEAAKAEAETAEMEAARSKPPDRRAAQTLLEQWDTLSALNRRNILATLIERVDIFPPERPHQPSQAVVVPLWAD